jgi:RNAse (barnase) inhibitor barstar
MSGAPEHAVDSRSNQSALMVTIPASIRSKQKLLRTLSQQFQLPAYFGHNWDALEECLRDLSWLPAGNIEVHHQDIPLSPGSQDRQTYLQILQSSAAFWSETGKRRFECIFPRTTLAEILATHE